MVKMGHDETFFRARVVDVQIFISRLQCAATKRTASTCKYLFVNVINHFQQSHHHFEKKTVLYDLQHSYADVAAVCSEKKKGSTLLKKSFLTFFWPLPDIQC